MNIKCDKCGRIHEVDADRAGSCLLCSCGAAMIIPLMEQPAPHPQEGETFIIACPLCFEQYEVNVSVIGQTLSCCTCGAKWQIVQWWTNPQQPEPVDDIDTAVSNAEVQYQPKSPEMIQFPPLSEVNRENRFCGKCVLFTGFYAEEKEQLAPIIDFLRIRQAASVCQKLDFLICGTNAGPSKMQKAADMGKPIVPAADFIREITAGNTPG